MPKNIFIPISIVLALVVIWMIVPFGASNQVVELDANTVRIENGTQMIRIVANGGYFPNTITAQANIDTVLEVETNGTYDCSSSLTIPKLSYRKSLPSTGVTQIAIAKEKATGSLDILCSMGMYGSTITFTN